MVDYRHAQLLICCLHFLDEKIKSRINYFLYGHFLDKALYNAIKEGNFPRWFKESFFYDALYGRLIGLRKSLSYARRGLLVEYAYTGGGTSVRLVLSDDLCYSLIRNLGLDPKEVKGWAKRIEYFLLEAEKRA